ncbi:MAG: hypothetical protein HC793_04140 [Aquincola sp.]|nr:hypothetical protein [Aquincola sp.]
MTHSPLRRKPWLAFGWAVWLLPALVGCATERPRTDEPLERHQVLTELAAGQLRLSCEFSCAATWRLERATLKGLYTNQLWGELAVGVARVGYTSDLAYFYLGRAAEELGKLRAAETYYRLALAATARCDGWLINSCDGVRLPNEATAALARVTTR